MSLKLLEIGQQLGGINLLPCPGQGELNGSVS